MTSQDFSLQFDLLYNNIASNQAAGLTEYEKSVFLTQAQESLILDLYKGTAGDSFETTEEVTRYLSSLVRTKNDFDFDRTLEVSIDISSIKDLWFITYQSASLSNDRDVLVVPTTQDSLFKELKNPFSGPNLNKILSLSEDNKITLYSKYPIKSFYIKYLKRPNPIVLEDSELPIGNVNTFNIEIPESLHLQVLLRAVQLAKAVWQS